MESPKNPPASSASVSAPPPPAGFWPEGWWKLMEYKIGIIPLPVYAVLAAILVYFGVVGKLPTECSMMMALLAVYGFTCGEIGKHLPVLKHFGAAAILATFLPSAMVYYHWMPKEFVAATTDFTKSTAFLFLFIAAIIVGSIFGMDRQTLIKGFFKIIVPTALGTIVAAIVGTCVGKLVGLGFRHAFYYVVIPIMAGGVGEGAIPLSMGYAVILKHDWGAIFAQVLPPVMFGSLTAILLAGMLNYLGKKRPDLTGYGRLNPGEQDELNPQQTKIEDHLDIGYIAAAAITTIAIYLVGVVLFRITAAVGFPIPAPVGMLFLAVGIKLSHAVPPKLQQGAFVVYRLFAVGVTYPLLFAVGVAMTPWDKLIAAFALPNLLTIVSTVVAMMATSFFTARWINCYPIDVTIINACRCAQGGTGNVAILTASDRMQLMPFAQVATRIGGAITVTVALVAFAKLR